MNAIQCFAATFSVALACGAAAISPAAQNTVAASAETQIRSGIAAASLTDAVVIDCQLPGRLIQLGGSRNYLSPGTLQRLTAIDCRTRGGEYTIGDLAGGTFSLRRWLPVAEKGDAEAQYYVARIYANGMGGVSQDYGNAAQWYQRAAAQKYAPAMQELGYLYEKGLGVKEDRLMAINLQRQASGLGDDLDYAWKLAAAKEDAARQAAQLSQQLEDSNAQLDAMRVQVAQTGDDLAKANGRLSESRATLAQSQGVVKQLRAKLLESPSGDADRVKKLQADLAAKETEIASKEKAVGDAQSGMSELQQRFANQQAGLEASLAQSQTANVQLTELLATRQEETNDLRARLAQSEQRLIRSQQELTDLRTQFRQGVDQLAAQKGLLAQLKSKQSDGDAALAAAQQTELDQQTRKVRDLTAQLELLRKAQAADQGNSAKQADNANAATLSANAAAATANAAVATANAAATAAAKRATAADAQNGVLRTEMARLQTQIAEQTNQLESERKQMANWGTKSEADREAIVHDMTAKMQARSAELDGQQRRIASLEADSAMLREEVTRYRDARERDTTAAQGEANLAREALRAAQQKISDQRDQLDQLKTQYATDRSDLLKDHDKLEMALARSNADREQEVGSLKADIQEKETILAARMQRITALEKQIAAAPPVMASNIVWRSGGEPAATAAKATAAAPMLPPMGSGNFYALVIGNSNYRYMGGLVTPINDAKAVADLLEQRYGFKVNLLEDATASKIMLALHDYTRMLTDSDRLLVYYAGHGGSQDGPPEAAFWLGVDADPDTREGFLSSEMIRGKIKDMKARHVLLVADSCFSSAITHPTTTTIGRGISQKRFEVQWNRRARMVLTSGMDTPVVDSSGDRTHSLFATYFIQILRQSDEVMSGEMLSHELSTRMQFEARRLKVSQTPTYSSLNDANHDFGDFFFVPTVTTTVAALR